MPFYYDTVYWVALIPILILSVYAQIKVSSSFNRYSRIRNQRNITGAMAADAVLRAHGIRDVIIRPCRGYLSDHYDPRSNTIFLSESVFDQATVAAVGVAAHEAGHAVQYAVGYGPIKLRMAILPVTRFGSQFSFLAIALGLILEAQSLFAVGIILFATTTFFQLVTLPVEFNASGRAIGTIEGAYLLNEEEQKGAKKVLSAAALTYVAALLTSMLQLLRYLMLFSGRNDRRRR